MNRWDVRAFLACLRLDQCVLADGGRWQRSGQQKWSGSSSSVQVVYVGVKETEFEEGGTIHAFSGRRFTLGSYLSTPHSSTMLQFSSTCGPSTSQLRSACMMLLGWRKSEVAGSSGPVTPHNSRALRATTQSPRSMYNSRDLVVNCPPKIPVPLSRTYPSRRFQVATPFHQPES